MIESEWPESDLLLRTAFGSPIFPDTRSQLLPSWSGSTTSSIRPSCCLGFGCTISYTCMPRPCCELRGPRRAARTCRAAAGGHGRPLRTGPSMYSPGSPRVAPVHPIMARCRHAYRVDWSVGLSARIR